MAVRLSTKAETDLRRLDHRVRDRLAKKLQQLGPSSWPANLDVKPLVGRSPWLRLRVGDYRVLFRRAANGEPFVLVARIVHRRDLERAVESLIVPDDDE